MWHIYHSFVASMFNSDQHDSCSSSAGQILRSNCITIVALRHRCGDQLMCRNGNCVPILYRCDGLIQCTDGSDEIECRMYSIDVCHWL